MSSLFNTSPSQNFNRLIQFGNNTNTGVSDNLTPLQDGGGNNLPIAFNSSDVYISGNVANTANLSIGNDNVLGGFRSVVIGESNNLGATDSLCVGQSNTCNGANNIIAGGGHDDANNTAVYIFGDQPISAANGSIVYLAVMNGVVYSPVAEPSIPVEGNLYYDVDSKNFRFYNGTDWLTISAS